MSVLQSEQDGEEREVARFWLLGILKHVILNFQWT